MKIRLKEFSFKTFFFTVIIIVCAINSLMAQDNDIRFNHYTTKDGLSQNTVLSILQDHHGFMWFGTRTGGLNKFNGYSFTTYKNKVNDSLSISSNEILALHEDKYGMLWIGTRNGSVSRYDENNDSFYNYTEKSNDETSISSKTVSCIFEDSQENLWFGTNYGLCEYNREKDNFIRHNDKTTFKKINIKVIVQAGENLLWVGSKTGLFLYNTQSKKVLRHFQYEEDNPTSISGSHIMALAIDAYGKLWIGTNQNGLNRLDDPEKAVFTHFKNDIKNKNSISSNVIRTLHFDKKNVLWVGTRKALEKVLPNEQNSPKPVFIHYKNQTNNSYSISQSSIFSFYAADDDNFWVGSYIGGVNQFYNGSKKFKEISPYTLGSKILNDDLVNAFSETEDGVWAGTERGGLYFFEPKTGESKVFALNENESNLLENNHIKSLFVDGLGDLWVGTYKGLYLYDRSKSQFEVCVKGKYIYSIAEGIPGEIWVGTNKGLFKVNKPDLTIVESYFGVKNKKNIVAKDIQKVYKDIKGQIWVLAKTGLYKYNRLNNSYDRFFHRDNEKGSLSHSYSICINEDTEGNIWIGTLNGLNRLDEKTMQFEHFGEAEGLPDNVVKNILFDNSGNLWITTNKGLSKIEKSVFLNKKLKNSTKINEIWNFDIEDGLINTEFKQNASIKNKKGVLFFGGIGGFNFFNPDDIMGNPHMPKVALTSFKLFNKEVIPSSKNSLISKPIWLTESITLNHKQSSIIFEFAAFNYTSPSKNQYAYILEGYDKEWNYVGSKHEATYTSLPAGNYTFRVKASNNDGLWNEQGSSLEIVITPAIWERWWFKVFIAGVILALFALYFNKRISKEKKLNRLLENKVLVRTAELREKNNLLSQKTKILNESNKTLIDRQKLIEEQTAKIKIQHDKLSEANLLKDKLFSVIGHDLRSPFNSILGFSNLLVNDFYAIEDDKKLLFAKNIAASSQIVFELLNNLLLWARTQQGILKPNYKLCNIIELLKNNRKIAELQAKDKNIQITNNFNGEEFQVVLDANLINTVIRNLLSNAIKFTHLDGKIELSYYIENNMIIVSVKDNGVGISKEAQEKIFYNNTTLTSKGTNNEKGTGLGLLICQDFINLHNGKIWVNSEIGKGSEFCFSLPIVRVD